jgi:hypothetical protein
MIQLKKDTEIASAWSCPTSDGDFFALVIKHPSERWVGYYRFRHVVAGQPDTKTWFQLGNDDDKARLVHALDAAVRQLCEALGESFDRVDINDSGDDALLKLMQLMGAELVGAIEA